MGYDEALRGFDQIGIERPGQAFVAGHEHDIYIFRLAGGEPCAFRGAFIGLRGLGEIREEFAHLRSVRPGRDDAFLGAAQFCGRDHFHGLGDLLRVLDGADAPPEIDQAGHKEGQVTNLSYTASFFREAGF